MGEKLAEGPDCTFLPGQPVCYVERSSSPTNSGRTQPARGGENHLANVNCRTYSGKHPARDCVAGPFRESSHDRRWSG